MLEGIKLYLSGVANKIIMTGDHGRKEYDEVNVMKDFAIDKGIPSEDIFADPRQYVGQSMRELREILARNKDFVKCIFKPEPTYLGDVIPVSGNGNLTNDKASNDNETIEGK